MRLIIPVILCALCFFQSCTTKPPRTITRIVKDTVVLEKEKIKEVVGHMAELPGYVMDLSDYPAVAQNERIRFLVMHYTALDHEPSVRVLSKLGSVSSHYLVTDHDDDSIKLLVREDKRAWHAGYSYWSGRENLNDTSIGIEIVNKGYKMVNGEQVYFDYPEIQFKKVAILAKDIVNRYQIEPINVIGHSDVAPQRKYDPGPKFPWKRLYDEYGVGAWYDESTKKKYMNIFNDESLEQSTFITQMQKDFNKLGYEIAITGLWDNQTRKVITVFQHHFRPENYNGELDKESWAILQALIEKYRK